MCFSAKASLSTLIIGLIGSLAVYQLPKPEDKVLGLFFAFVSLMQGIDYTLWMHPTCDVFNRDVSRVGMWLNHHQPIVLSSLILAYFPKTPWKSVILLLTTLYFSAVLAYGLQFNRLPKEQQCTHTETDPHISYSWSMLPGSNALYIFFLSLFMAFPLLGFQNKSIASAVVIAGSLSWITTDLVYKKKYFSSLWCFYAAFLPLLYLGARTSNYI